MELSINKYEQLLNHPVITNTQKRNFLKSKGIDAYGTKRELNAKIIFNWFKPSDFLNYLTTKSLHRIADKLGIKKSGSKQEKIENIIKYYERIYKPPDELQDVREVYYQFYEDLADRNQAKLIKKGIITKGEEIGKKFEEATEFLFENVLGFRIEDPKIKDRKHGVKADGKAVKNNEFIIWDCKTKNKYLTISTSERRQFIDYITEYKKTDRGKFISFLIVTSEVKDPIDIRKKLIEIKKETEVNISVIKATDLKKFAEQVKKLGAEIDLTPFYQTDVICYERHLKPFIIKK